MRGWGEGWGIAKGQQFVVRRVVPDPVLSCRAFCLGLFHHYNHQDAAVNQVSSEAV